MRLKIFYSKCLSTPCWIESFRISGPYGPEFFFPSLISTTRSVVFIAARIAYIRFLTAMHIYDFHIFTVIKRIVIYVHVKECELMLSWYML